MYLWKNKLFLNGIGVYAYIFFSETLQGWVVFILFHFFSWEAKTWSKMTNRYLEQEEYFLKMTKKMQQLLSQPYICIFTDICAY